MIERQRREFRRRRFLELTEHSRRDDSKDRVLELIEKLRRNREKIKKWVAVNQCDDDEKESEKEKNYKSVSETFLSTIIIEIIIVIIIIIIIIIEENVDFCEDFDILFICFVEFFSSVSSLKEEDWEEVSKSEFEKSLKKKFVCAVCFFCWICSVERHSFRLWILRFDFDFFSIFCFWICCVFDFSFDFRKFREWKSIVCVVFLDEKERSWDWKRNCVYFLFFCLRLRQFVDWKFIRFYFFCLWVEFIDFLCWVVCFSEHEKVQNRSERYKVSWKIYYHWRWCYEFLRNVWLEFFISK